ncbi:hypothetical protein BOTNAR_0202g00110 [Botryotinia narcissicola]|uniref:Protein kinase domain-containing protein n=1 Tax=Botryotinia narcissicola TaxID=278944 RepID=A0A4Z1IL31_9HELO|nr:hypothetical protein BOTNAR_0202g00110 [Botryotinia narcissicola]
MVTINFHTRWTYVINLYETPNRVNKNGLTFTCKLFVPGDANANQIVASDSETTSAVKQVVKITTSASTTTSQKQKMTVVLPASTTDAVTSTAASSTRAETRASESTEIVFAASTSGGSSSESPQASTISSILSTLKTIVIAEVIGLLGSSPLDLVETGVRASEFFEKKLRNIGKWIAEVPIPQGMNLEKSEMRLESKNKEVFLQMMRGMLQWRPEDRKTAKQMLEEPWINRMIE